MKAKYKHRRVRGECKVILCVMFALIAFIVVKGNEPKVVGYTYDSGSTVWEMARKCCPEGVDIQCVAREIERVNGIENCIVYDYIQYKVPVYE